MLSRYPPTCYVKYCYNVRFLFTHCKNNGITEHHINKFVPFTWRVMRFTAIKNARQTGYFSSYR